MGEPSIEEVLEILPRLMLVRGRLQAPNGYDLRRLRIWLIATKAKGVKSVLL
jgi:hypothetical protein